MDLKTLPITQQADIPTSYLDEMGHMNVMWYTHLFSQATGGFFNRFGMDLAYMEKEQAGSFALEAHLRYFAEIHAGNRVTVRTRALGRTVKRFHFLHLMTIDGEDRLAATCEFIGAHMDMSIRRMAPIPQAIAASFDRMLGDHQQLPWEPQLSAPMHP